MTLASAGPAVDWDAWRAEFPGLDAVTYLNTSSHGAKSERVAASLRAYMESWTTDPPWDDDWQRVVRTAEAAFGRLIGAADRDVVMVPTLTDAFHRAMSALHSDHRTRVVLSAREWVSLRHAVAAWPGIEPVVVDAELDPDSDAFLTNVGDDTRLVVVSHVCFRTGYRADLAAIVAKARRHGARVFVDAFQSAGVTPIDVARTPVDFLAAGSLKYLLGVPGAAFLYVHPEASRGTVPGLSGWRGQCEPMDPTLAPSDGAARFAGGTWMVPNAYAAAAGLALIAEAGVENIAARVTTLVGSFLAELADAGVAATTPDHPAKRAGIVVVPCEHASATVERLRAARVVASARTDALRFSFHAYNSEAEARAVARRLPEFLQNGSRHA